MLKCVKKMPMLSYLYTKYADFRPKINGDTLSVKKTMYKMNKILKFYCKVVIHVI